MRRARLLGIVGLAASLLGFAMPAGAGAALSFAPQDTWVANGKPLAIGAEQITGGASAGYLDVVTANFDTDTISIYDGPFFQPGLGDPPPHQQTVGDGPSALAMGQFNATFPADIAIANANADTVLVRFGSSIGFLSVDERTYPVGNEPVSVAVGQFSGAGAAQQDLAVANASDDTVSVLLADTSGFFGAHTTFPVGDRPVSVTQEDFDQNGARDLAVANFNSNTVSVLRGNGNGTFQAQQTYAVGARPTAVVMGDFNPWLDGHWDIAVANSLDNTVSVLLGNGDGTFQAQDVYPVSTSPSALTVGDFDADGKNDLVVANRGSARVSVLPGNLDGTFRPHQTFMTGNGPAALLTANLGVNDKPDIAVANFDDSTVGVLINDSTPPPPPPVPTTTAATGVTSTSASLNSTINPQGSHTFYKYEYGLTTSFGSVIGPFDAGSGSTPVAQSPRAITGLQSARTYYYRVCVRSDAGAGQTCGAAVAFSTAGSAPPEATTSFLEQAGADVRFTGTVNPRGLPTAFTFEYGTSPSLGSITTVDNAGSGTAAGSVSAVIPLGPTNKTFYFRLVATNSLGTATGVLRSATTSWASRVPVATTGSATSITSTGATFNGTVDPSGGGQTAFMFEYGVGSSLNTITTVDSVASTGGPLAVSLPAGTLTPGTVYCFRLVATNGFGTSTGALRCFTTGGTSAPIATTGAATAVANTTAQLNGTVDAHGTATSYVFEYGTTASFGQVAPVPAGNVGAGAGSSPVSASLAGLAQNTTYRYRLVATSALGTSSGAVRTFTTGPFTAPAATTAAATNVAASTATLNATINPRGQATAFTFEYGTTPTFGNITSVDMLDPLPGAHPVSLPVGGLAAATTYHYRVVATNASGTTTGATMTFTTNAVRSLFWTETVIFGTGSVNVVSRDDPSEAEQLLDGIIHAYGIAANADHVFWGNLNVAAVGRIDVDGTGANPNFITTTSPPVAMTVTSTHIYWVNSDANTIGRANLDGTGVNNSFIATGSGPNGVAVNASHIFWTNQTDNTIGRANLNGTGVNNTLVTGANSPEGITLDGAHIYWGNTSAVGRANLDGTGVNHSFVPATNGVGAVAVDSTHIYYANWFDNAIARANLDGTGLNKIWKQLGSRPTALAIPAPPT